MEEKDEKDLLPENNLLEIPEFDSLEDLEKAQGKVVTDTDTQDEENEEETDDTTQTTVDNENNESSEGGESPYKVWAEILKERGIIDYKDDEFAEDDDFLVSKYEESVDKKAKEYLDEIVPDDLKEMFKKYQKGVPLDTLIKVQSESVRLDQIKIEDLEDNEDLQEKMVRQAQEILGLDKEEIDEKIEDLKDANLLFKESKASVKIIKKNLDNVEKDAERLKEIELEKKQTQKAQLINELKTKIYSTDEVIPGLKISASEKEKFFKGITEVGKDGMTELLRKATKDPDWELKSAYFLLMMDGKLDKITADNKNKVAKKFLEKADTYKESKFDKLDVRAIEKALAKSK